MLRLAGPMLVGIGVIILFQVVDTYFVGQLGPRALAAMGFTFPAAFVVFAVTMGIGTGTTAVIARAIGEGDREQVRRLATDALLLAAFVVGVVAATGILFADVVFRAMGASEEMVTLISSYMVPWFAGVAMLMVPMVGNSVIRATGDTKSPAVIMIIAGVVNLVLDPFLIFGWGPFPRLELLGAALATVAAWAVTFVASLWLLIRRENLIVFGVPSVRSLWSSWKRILYVGLPAAGTNLLIPLSAGIITRIVVGHGELAVAAFGVGTRLEGLAMIGVNALSTALTPFIGQNFGARHDDRVVEATRFTQRAAFLWGAAAALVLGLFAPSLARLFNDDPFVIRTTVAYLRLIPVSYGALGMAMLANTTFIALNRPLPASIIIVSRLLLLAVPLAYLGSEFYGLDGLFVGIAIANGLVGLLAVAMLRRSVAALARLSNTPPSSGA